MNGRELGSDVQGMAGAVPVLTTKGLPERMTVCPACQEMHSLPDYCGDCNRLMERYGPVESLLSAVPDNRVQGGIVPHYSLRSSVQRGYFWLIRRPFWERLILAQMVAVVLGVAAELVVLRLFGCWPR